MTDPPNEAMVSVTQQDREAAAEAAQTIYYANSDVLCEADVEEMRDVFGEAFARHREASVAELVEALRAVEAAMSCGSSEDRACYCPNCDNSFFNARETIRAALTRAVIASRVEPIPYLEQAIPRAEAANEAFNANKLCQFEFEALIAGAKRYAALSTILDEKGKKQ